MNSNIKSEFARKAIHISNAIIPLSYLYLIQDNIDMIIILAFFLVLCFFIEIARKENYLVSIFFSKRLSFMMRDDEKKGEITGATWVFVGALFTILLIPYPYSIYALLFLSVGDTFAAIIGMKFPFIKVGGKTISGSISGFLACVIVGLIIDFSISYDDSSFFAYILLIFIFINTGEFNWVVIRVDFLLLSLYAQLLSSLQYDL